MTSTSDWPLMPAMLISSRAFRLSLPIVIGVVVAACASTSGARDPESGAPDLASLKAYTSAFRSIDSAAVAGYPRVVNDCLIHELHGAMGFHHVNSALVDRAVDIRHPEILLYERAQDSTYRLNAVEFIVPFRLWPPDSVPPQIMGQQLRRDTNLKIWYLHVWAWRQNPNGLFANFHPDVRCPPGASKVFRPSDG